MRTREEELVLVTLRAILVEELPSNLSQSTDFTLPKHATMITELVRYLTIKDEEQGLHGVVIQLSSVQITDSPPVSDDGIAHGEVLVLQDPGQ